MPRSESSDYIVLSHAVIEMEVGLGAEVRITYRFSASGENLTGKVDLVKTADGNVGVVARSGDDLISDLKAFDFKIADATEDQMAALDHAFKRHGEELSQLINKPIKWTKKSELQTMLDNFNEAVSLIRREGTLTGKTKVPFGIKGSGVSSDLTEVDVYIYKYVVDNNEYYLYLRSSDQKFVSGGLKTKEINYID